MGKCLYMRKGLIHEAPQLVDPHTLLLIHGDGLIKDSSMYHVPLNNVGVQASTDQSKFGGKSLYFVNDNYLNATIPELSKDFTVDFWAYKALNRQPYPWPMYLWDHATPSPALRVVLPSGNVIKFAYKNSFDVKSETTFNNWIHMAIVKHNSVIKCYVNGVYKGTITGSTMLDRVQLGRGPLPTSTVVFDGYIDEFRISNVARWTSNFTPPTEPYKG